MLDAIEQLLVIQDRDRKLKSLLVEKKALPGEKLLLEKALVDAKARLEAARMKLKENEVARRKLELDVEQKQTSIGKFKSQQMQTRKNEEFQALSNEIKRFEGDVVGLEDQELELMEEAERLKRVVEETEKRFQAEKTQIETALRAGEEKVGALDKRIAELEAERASLAKEVDEDTLDRYERLFKSKGDLAIVGLTKEVCGGCHMRLPLQTSLKVKAEQEIVHCDQCGRILYYND